MGVDLLIAHGYGYAVYNRDIEDITCEEWEQLGDRVNESIGVYDQSGYGDRDNDSSTMFMWRDDSYEILRSEKIGDTPFVFLADQQYRIRPDFVRAGAQKYFTVALNHYEDVEEDNEAMKRKVEFDKALITEFPFLKDKIAEWTKKNLYNHWLFSYFW